MQLSIVIPTMNEAENVRALLPLLRARGGSAVGEILVIDAGSTDGTIAVAKGCGADRAVLSPQRGRSRQMNYGAALSHHKILYFVHADTRPPAGFADQIVAAVENGTDAGCFRFRFDGGPALLRINSYFTRFNNNLASRGGDQSLFITRKLFDKLAGFREEMVVCEDYDIVERAQRRGRFEVLPDDIVVSARKYETNSYVRVQFANLVCFSMYRLGVDTHRIKRTYARLLDYR